MPPVLLPLVFRKNHGLRPRSTKPPLLDLDLELELELEARMQCK